MDGYAVRSADLPGVLRIVGRVAAGRPESRVLGAGEAIEISTGGVVPEGADTVVPIERVEVRGDEVAFPEAASAKDNIREPGGDVSIGALLLAAGEVLTPARLGALAACGIGEVVSRRVPRVAIVVTGTELRPAGEPLGPGQIYESNGVMLAAALEAVGADVERLAAAEDTEEAHAEALERALGADVVVTTGGVSVGPHDLVRRVEAGLGVEEVFWGVAMRPGKPLAFGCRGRTLVFGLPGNPGLDARRLPPLRPPRAARAPGPPRSCASVSPRSAGGRASRGGPNETTSSAPESLGGRRRSDRPDRRAGITHDRANDRRRSDRLDPAGTRRARGGSSGALSPL